MSGTRGPSARPARWSCRAEPVIGPVAAAGGMAASSAVKPAQRKEAMAMVQKRSRMISK